MPTNDRVLQGLLVCTALAGLHVGSPSFGEGPANAGSVSDFEPVVVQDLTVSFVRPLATVIAESEDLTRLRADAAGFGLTVRPLVRQTVSAEAAARHHAAGFDRTFVIEGPAGTDPTRLAALPDYWTITGVRSLRNHGTATSPTIPADQDSGQDPGRSTQAGDDPSLLPAVDPLIDEQWALRNPLDSGDVRAEPFWQLLRARPEFPWADRPVVAVLDAGIDPLHPDLRRVVLPGLNVTGGPADDVVDLVNSHGTSVAGIIAAPRGDGIGIAGLAPHVDILPVRMITSFGFTLDAWAAEALIWATDQGADVVVMAFSFPFAGPVFHDAVRYADEQGVVLVASSGNTGGNAIGFPAAWPEVIAVGASNRFDQIDTFSAGGNLLDLVAPGVDILAPYSGSQGLSTHRFETGTSFAAPFVGAVAATLRGIEPRFTPSDIRNLINSSADELNALPPQANAGAGRLNAAAAALAAAAIADCDADVNLDGLLNGADFSAWLTAFGESDPAADINNNGTIDGSDFSAWLLEFATGCESYATPTE